MHILKFAGILLVVATAFYGVIWFARKRMGSTSDVPITRGGNTGGTQAPK
jgi:hypothetical protein